MARVTKINVGGTNYDIAHEGELKNSGFEVVTSLPTTGLFAGREVMYNGKKYLCNGERWLTPIRFYQIANDVLITEPGWYNIGYYDDNFNASEYNFDGILTISSAYSTSRGTSAIIAITSSFNEICFTQLSGYKTAVIPQIRIVMDSNIRFLLQFQYATTSRNPVNITYTDYRSTNPYRNPFKPLFGKSDIEFEENAIVKVFTLTKGVKTDYNVEGASIIKTGGAATQMLMADGSTKDISSFATVATSGSYNDLTDKPALFSGSYDDLTNKPTLATVATSGSYNDLTDKPKLYEANLLWGGRNMAASFSPIDAAMMPELSANVMAFPNPAGITVEYSRDGGVTWLDYGAADWQKVSLFTTETSLYCGKSYPDGLTATVGYQLRITITPKDCGLYTKLNKIIMNVSRDDGNDCWATFKGLKAREVAAGNENDAYYDTFVNKAYINGWPGYNVLNFNEIRTASYTTAPSQANAYYRLRLIFGYDTALDSTSYAGLRIKLLRFFGDGRYNLPSNLATNNRLYTYDWQKNAYFPAKVQSNEIINFDVNNIEPTQTGSAVTKTSTWLWQYLVQGINWLKANKFSGSYDDLTNKPALFSGSYDDLTGKPTLATVATSGSYDDLTNKPTLFSGSYNDLTDKPTLFSGSYNDLTDKPTLFSGSYNDLTDKPTLFSGSYEDLTDKPTLATVATSGSYNDLTDKPTFSGSYNDLTDKPTIPNSFTDLTGTISSVQISEGAVGNTQLANSSMTLNGIICELGGTKTLPCIISFNSTLYKVRIYQNWLQIYNAGTGTWVNKYYLSSNPPTECHYITDLSDPSWYDESVTEYELDNSATEQLLNANSSDNLANWLEAIGAQQITFNSSVILSKQFSKGALDNIISNLKGKGYSVFVENDLDTILQSGNDWVISIKIKKVNEPYKAIIECYVAR